MDHLLLLRDILEQEADVCCELLALSEQEKVAVMQNDVQALSSIVEKKQSALNGMQTLGNKRNKLTADIMAQSGAPHGGTGIMDVIRTAGGTLREELENLVIKLEGVGIKLKNANALNKMLIDTQQKYTSFCINLLTGRDGTPGTYSGSGRVEEGHESDPRLVDQAI